MRGVVVLWGGMVVIIAWSALGMAGALIGLLWLVRRPAAWMHSRVHAMVSFAAGVILATVFLDILPEAVEVAEETGRGGADKILLWTLVGFLAFYIFERLFFWAHCHGGVCDVHATGYMVLVGDTIHNFTDGMLVAATFLVDPTLGILTAIAVALHEIPQEFGEFAVFVGSGLSVKWAAGWNILSAAAAPIGAAVALLLLPVMEPFLGFVIAVAAGAFLYIAAADLIPEIHAHPERGSRWKHSVLLFLGVVLVAALASLVQE